MKKILAIVSVLTIIISVFSCGFAFADSPTDEILDYEITADINEDATVTLTYHIEWLVLESDVIGPLSWVNIGIPSSNYVSYEALSDNIDSISFSTTNGSNLEIYFKDEYYEGETVVFDYKVVQENMYQMNYNQDGVTSYVFTPGWFNEINVDKLVLRWNSDKVESWTPNCIQKDGYNTWETSLDAGDYYTVQVDYPNDAFDFDDSSYISDNYDYYNDGYYDDGYYDDDYYDNEGGIFSILGSIIPIIVVFNIIKAIKSKNEYDRKANFGDEDQKTEKKVTRTKVEYYPICEGCGAPRGENESVCQYCGRSLIKSEEILEEENITEEDEEAMKYDKTGEYKYSSNPNTFVRVNVVHIPVVHTASHSRGHSSGSGRGNSHGSCACACASCACACACACAGGGRAGCTNKDFYNTDLKLRQFELKAMMKSGKKQ